MPKLTGSQVVSSVLAAARISRRTKGITMPTDETCCTYVYPAKDYERPGEKCSAPLHSAGLCGRHYTQRQRGRLGKSRESAEPGEGSQITFQCDKTRKALAEKFARQLKITLGEFMRRLIDTYAER